MFEQPSNQRCQKGTSVFISKYTTTGNVSGERTYHEIVHEPGKRRSQHGLPVSSEDQQIRNLLLNGVFPILSRVDHAKSEKQQDNRHSEPETETDSPDSLAWVLVVCCQDNKGDDASDDKPKINGEVSGYCCEDTSSSSDVFIFIGCFCRCRGASWVFAYTVST